MTEFHRIAILGATGSVGRAALDVALRHPSRFSVAALAADSDDDKMLQACRSANPQFAAMRDEKSAMRLADKIKQAGLSVEIGGGENAIIQAATFAEANAVVSAIPGAAGLKPTMAAVQCGRRILLANKESLVIAGDFLMQAAEKNGAEILPIDSEHSALFQLLGARKKIGGAESDGGIARIWLTASGGPFLNCSADELECATPADACRHPNWTMGKKISTDSATLMNKGLEVIEASRLFGFGAERIGVVVHPQSIVHAMVEYADGAMSAHLSAPDIRLSVAHAMAHPERIAAGVAPPSWESLSNLSFSPPDENRFPCLTLAFDALRIGGAMPAIMNAANEIAVAKFLSGAIRFTKIPQIIKAAMDSLPNESADSLDDLLSADSRARLAAEKIADENQ